jgi:hypothetical protein
MSEKIDLQSGDEIRDWAGKTGFDVVSMESDAPRFFQPRFTPTPGPLALFTVEHTFNAGPGQPMVSVKRFFRVTSAEAALQQYLREPKERSAGTDETGVGFRVHLKPGTNSGEAIKVVKVAGA